MSNYLAVATVTETLRQTLLAAVQAQPGGPGGAQVTTGRPGDPAAGAAPTINLFLYHVTPNAAWRNEDLATRDESGRIVQRPRAALDLHYLLTFYGEDGRQEAQQLMGIAVRTMHAQPVLSRQAIAAAIGAAPGNFLAASDLANSVELVRFTPSTLSLEELSKLWSVFFQTQYALSTGYIGSVVLVETDDVPLPVLPVLARDVYVIPIRIPVVDRVVPSTGAGWPIVPGSLIRVEGHNLLAPPGEITTLLIDGVDQIAQAIPPPTNSVVAFQLQRTLPAPLPPPVLSLPAGAHWVQVKHLLPMGAGAPPIPHPGPESNLVAFVLAPNIIQRVTLTNVAGAGLAPRSGKVNFSVDPPIAAGQVAILTLVSTATGDPFTFPISTAAAPGNPLTVAVSGLPAGDYFVRLQVDSVMSPMERDTTPGSPTFGLYSGPKVTFP
jgi:Pvc16 N-terminal domain